MPTPLARIDSPLVKHIANEDPNFLSAYNICLNCELELAAFRHKQRHARIVGFLLLYAPNQEVCAEVTKSIHSCKDNIDLTNLGAFLEQNVMLPFIKFKSQTPEPSECPSRFSFETINERINVTQVPRNHKDAKEQALVRDGWKCTTTSTLDRRAPIVKDAPKSSVAVYTKCAHIIPNVMFNFEVESQLKENAKLDCLAFVQAILKQFYHDIEKLDKVHVHSLINVLTLEYNVYDAFNRLELYFEATPQKDHYEVKWFDFCPHHHLPQFVTFSTPDPKNLPLPAPELLALHATLCKVAHFSGATEYIDEVCHAAEETDVLLADGTSADMLSYVLLFQEKQNIVATDY